MRNANIEVLRAVLMFLIVLGHCCYTDTLRSMPIAQLIQTMTVFSVDAFVFISGWYSIRLRFAKVFSLCGVALYAAVVLFLLSPLARGAWRFSYSLGWFGNSYLGLMLLSPFLNAGVERLRSQGLVPILFACTVLIIFGWLPLSDLGINLRPSGCSSHTVCAMAYVYLLARCLALLRADERVGVGLLVTMAITSWTLMVGWVLAGHWFRDNGTVFGWLLRADGWSYLSPFVVLTASSVFLVFLRISIPCWLCRICSFLAPSVFGIYLYHSAVNPETSCAFMERLQQTEIAWMGSGVLSVAFVAFSSAVVVYFLGVMLDLFRRMSVRWLGLRELVDKVELHSFWREKEGKR